MSWLQLLKLVLSLASHLAEIVRERRLMAAGEARALARALEKQNDRIDKALAARRAAGTRPDAGDPERDDGFRRD